MKKAAFLVAALNAFIARQAQAADLPATVAPSGPPIFDDRFTVLDAGPDEGTTARPHRWRTIVKGGTDATARSLNATTYFGDATTGVEPFTVGRDGLAVTATRRAGPFGKTWNSGFLSTKLSFSFLHGYAEARANLPTCVKGAWAAPLWLLPVRGEWPRHGEIDAPETIGKVDLLTGLGANNWTVITAPNGRKTQWSAATPMPCARGWHDYGILWRPDFVGFYLDRKLVAQTRTPADLSEPMYLVMDLIVGGAWPGEPDPSLERVGMAISRVSVWR